MTEHDRLRKLLEPEAPGSIPPPPPAWTPAWRPPCAGGRPRRAAALVPGRGAALLALLALLWLGPWQRGDARKGYVVLSEQEYLSALQPRSPPAATWTMSSSAMTRTWSSTTDNWTDEDWELFRRKLERFPAPRQRRQMMKRTTSSP